MTDTIKTFDRPAYLWPDGYYRTTPPTGVGLDTHPQNQYPYNRRTYLQDEIFLTLLRGMPNATIDDLIERTNKVLDTYLGRTQT